MESQIINQFHRDNSKERAEQGDILKDLSLVSYDGLDDQGDSIFIKTSLQYAIIISQDCDLLNDFNFRQKEGSDSDKFLSNILILPAYLVNDFKQGTHRGDFKGKVWNGDLWKSIKANKNQRFHYIQGDTKLFQIPEVILDFKQVYAIQRGFLYQNLQNCYLSTICELYRENISIRYTQFLSRIGLPDLSTD